MPVFKPRNRLVNFRLSEEEFSKLQGGCQYNGARSLSDYARSCVLRDLVPEKTEQMSEPRDSRVQEISQKVNILESRIEDLLKLIDSLRTSSFATAPDVPVAAAVLRDVPAMNSGESI